MRPKFTDLLCAKSCRLATQAAVIVVTFNASFEASSSSFFHALHFN